MLKKNHFKCVSLYLHLLQLFLFCIIYVFLISLVQPQQVSTSVTQGSIRQSRNENRSFSSGTVKGSACAEIVEWHARNGSSSAPGKVHVHTRLSKVIYTESNIAPDGNIEMRGSP